jgi:subtilisin family serine protease/ketosteroid isomerase-like protein
VIARLLVIVLALVLSNGSLAQTRKKVEKAADLPRFSYKVDGNLEELVRNEAKFRPFADAVRRDTATVLAEYEIPDKATERDLLGTLAQIDYLAGRYDDALGELARIKALQEKPADKLLSGLQMQAFIEARQKSGSTDAYRDEVARRIRAALDGMPYEVIENDVKTSKMRAELIGEALVLGNVREVLQPTVDKAGALSSDIAPGVIRARFALNAVLPLKAALIDAYAGYLAAHHVDKPDIWAARNVTLPPGKNYAAVNVAIWDSGVDTSLFPGRIVTEADGQPAVIAFDKYSRPATGTLFPLPEDARRNIPLIKARLKGFSDLQSNVDSPEASEVKQWLSTLKPAEYKAAIEEIDAAGNYIHGTHVAGIAAKGNPYIRLLTARIEFDWKLLPDPCPSEELSQRTAAASQAYVDFMKANGVRVANMSWGGSVKGVEEQLELCGIGKTPEERKALARHLFQIERSGLEKAMRSAPGILFVAAAGNENSDASFTESIPAGIDLPNLLAVGAVDKAGDEAAFTSYGPTVRVHANGYQVESVIPGGEKLAESGTSMAAPQVTNLAAKILAVNPRLKPADVIALIVKTADRTTDGRRVLIDPAKAVAEAQHERVREEITQSLKAFNAATARGDIAAVMTQFDASDDILAAGSGKSQVFRGRERVKAWFEKLFETSRFTWDLTKVTVSDSGDAAWAFVDGAMALSGKDGVVRASVPYRITAVFVRDVAGAWKWRVFSGAIPAGE